MKKFILLLIIPFGFIYSNSFAQKEKANKEENKSSGTENTIEVVIPAKTMLVADTSFEHSFKDEFSSPGKWAEEDNLNSTLKRKEGHYLFENKKNILYASTMPIGMNSKKNFAVETSIQHLSGENYYGVLIGGEETDGTLFMINPHTKSYWILYNNAEGSSDYFKKENSAIVTKDVNVLRTEKVGFKQRFFLNDAYIGEVPFVEFMGNKHGFIIDGQGMFSVDYFKIQWGN
ncbi:MAG: hypothetical protein V4667_00435 [Bacteroidota bacterium]